MKSLITLIPCSIYISNRLKKVWFKVKVIFAYDMGPDTAVLPSRDR